MSSTLIQDDLSVELFVREAVASSLAMAFSDPRRAGVRVRAMTQAEGELLVESWAFLRDAHADVPAGELGLGEVQPMKADIKPVVDWLMLPTAERETAHQLVFGLVISKICPPYETEYCHWTDPTYRAQHLADVAGFYKAFGLEPDPSQPQRHDHVSLELEFVAMLLRRRRGSLGNGPVEHQDIARDALASFVRDHVVWWMPTFARCVERRISKLFEQPAVRSDWSAQLAMLSGMSTMLQAWVAVERLASGVAPSTKIIAPQVIEPPATPACEMCKAKHENGSC